MDRSEAFNFTSDVMAVPATCQQIAIAVMINIYGLALWTVDGL